MPEALTISEAFMTKFESEVRHDFQKSKARLRGLVMNRNWTGAEKTRFQLYGKSKPGKKDSQGLLPISNPKHAYVECTVDGVYSGTYVDSMDVLQTTIDEQNAARTSIVSGFAREADEVILTAMDATTQELDLGGAIDKTDFETIFIHFGNNNIPEEDRYFCQDHGTWVQSLEIPEFAERDFLPEAMLPQGMSSWTEGKRFYSFLTFFMTGIENDGADSKCFAWHKSSVGHGQLRELTLKWSWENDRDSWFLNASASHGAVVIPEADSGECIGVVRVISTPQTASL